MNNSLLLSVLLIIISLTSSVECKENVSSDHKTSLRRRAEVDDTSTSINSSEGRQRDYDYSYPVRDVARSLSIEEKNDALLKDMVERMKPHSFQVEINDQDSEDPSIIVPPKQFFHLHHMKTGGTSLSGFIYCGTRRFKDIYQKIHNDEKANKVQINSYRLSECSQQRYLSCVSDPENRCRNSISDAAVMTYCAPLAIMDYFHWNGGAENLPLPSLSFVSSPSSKSSSSSRVPGVTMLRDPVERVWSMYRFQTKSCYKCKSLLEVYDDIDNGRDLSDYKGVCIPQLTNHLTRNLLTNLTLDELNNYTSEMTDEQQVNDAINSVRNRFTVVGIIERLEESIELFTNSFPWMTEDIRDSDSFGNEYDWENISSDMDEKEFVCQFPHANASPSNNRCGENGQHLDLSSVPDEETRRAIEKHNSLDMRVYAAALDHFELQKRAMNWEEEEDSE